MQPKVIVWSSLLVFKRQLKTSVPVSVSKIASFESYGLHTLGHTHPIERSTRTTKVVDKMREI